MLNPCLRASGRPRTSGSRIWSARCRFHILGSRRFSVAHLVSPPFLPSVDRPRASLLFYVRELVSDARNQETEAGQSAPCGVGSLRTPCSIS